MKKWKTGLCWALILALLCGNAAAAVNLTKGSLSWDVLFAEERLSQLGFTPGAADGAYGADTAEAVKAFQRSRGLQETGAVTDDTWDALFDETYQLRYIEALGKRDYRIRGKMPARFAKTELQASDNSVYGAEDQAFFTGLNNSITLVVWLVVGDGSMEELAATIRDSARDAFDQYFAAACGGTDFEHGEAEASRINGKPAQSWRTTWTYTNGEKVTRYWYNGIMELDPVGERQAYAVATMLYDTGDTALDEALGAGTVREALENVRCARDRLYAYQADAAGRLKASGLQDLTLPEFQPVDETEQDTLDIIYEIWRYVDPAADGAQGEMTGETCVSLYYGAKIMDRFMYYVNSGNTRDKARKECHSSLAKSIFYDDFAAAMPDIRERLAAALGAAKLALDEENEAYLTLLGLKKPEWTAEDLETITRSLLRTMDTLIESENQTP